MTQKAQDPWVTFMRAVTGTEIPIYVCGYFDSNGELQIKANGKLLPIVGVSSAVVEYFKCQLKNSVDKNSDPS